MEPPFKKQKNHPNSPSFDDLQKKSEMLAQNRVNPATLATYGTWLSKFEDFLVGYRIKAKSEPITKEHMTDQLMANFLTWMFQQGVAKSSIRGCRGALNHVLLNLNLKPLQNDDAHSYPLTAKVCEGMKRTDEWKNHVPKKAGTFAPEQIRKLFDIYADDSDESLTHRVLLALMTDCCLRTDSIYNLFPHHVTALPATSDAPEMFKIHLQFSKTDQFGAGHQNYIACSCKGTRHFTCGYHNVQMYIQRTQSFNGDGKLRFLKQLSSSKRQFCAGCMGKDKIASFPKIWNERLGNPLPNASGHSGRRTGLTTKANANMTLEELKKVSHHKSADMVAQYVDSAPHVVAKPSLVFANAINKFSAPTVSQPTLPPISVSLPPPPQLGAPLLNPDVPANKMKVAEFCMKAIESTNDTENLKIFGEILKNALN